MNVHKVLRTLFVTTEDVNSIVCNWLFIGRVNLSTILYAAQIEARVGELAGIWEKLAAASELKGSKLEEAAAQQHYNRAVEDIELWLSEVEGQLLSEDYGKVRTYTFRDVFRIGRPLLVTNRQVYEFSYYS